MKFSTAMQILYIPEFIAVGKHPTASFLGSVKDDKGSKGIFSNISYAVLKSMLFVIIPHTKQASSLAIAVTATLCFFCLKIIL